MFYLFFNSLYFVASINGIFLKIIYYVSCEIHRNEYIIFVDRFNDTATFSNSFINIYDLFVNTPEGRKYYLGPSYLNGDNYFFQLIGEREVNGEREEGR